MHAAQTAVAAEVARNYLELRGLQQRFEVAKESLVNQRDTLRLTTARLDAGRGTRLDVARAQSLYDSTEATLPALQAAIDRAAYRLATLTAQPPRFVAEHLAAPQLLPLLPVTDLSALPLGTPEQLLRRRPDLVAAERQLAAATADIGVATADLFPRVSLVGLIGFASNRVTDLGTRDSPQYSLGAGLTWPLLDFGRVRSRIAASEARAQQSLASYEQTVAIALEETEGALVQFTRNAQQAERLASAARNAEEATRLSRLRFDAGAVDLLVVLDAAAPVAGGARCAGAVAGRPGDGAGGDLPRARRRLDRRAAGGGGAALTCSLSRGRERVGVRALQSSVRRATRCSSSATSSGPLQRSVSSRLSSWARSSACSAVRPGLRPTMRREQRAHQSMFERTYSTPSWSQREGCGRV